MVTAASATASIVFNPQHWGTQLFLTVLLSVLFKIKSPEPSIHAGCKAECDSGPATDKAAQFSKTVRLFCLVYDKPSKGIFADASNAPFAPQKTCFKDGKPPHQRYNALSILICKI